jgi:hypothetical protein
VVEIDQSLEPHPDRLWALLSEPTLNTLARGLATQFMLLTPMPVDRLHERRTLKFGYDDQYRPPAGLETGERTLVRTLEALGWKATQYEFEVPGIARAQRYQAEIIAPPTLQIVFSELRTYSERGGAATIVMRAGATDSQVALQPAADVPAGSQGVVVVGFQADRVGLIRVAPLLGAFIFAILVIGKARLDKIHEDAAATLLLAVPTLFAALIVRPGEHALARRLLIGTRTLVLITGLATFVAAASLTGGWSHQTQHTIWNWAAWVTLVATVLLVIEMLVNRHRSHRGPREPEQLVATLDD